MQILAVLYYTHRKLTFKVFDDVLVFCCTELLHDVDLSVEAFLDALVLHITLFEHLERNLYKQSRGN